MKNTNNLEHVAIIMDGNGRWAKSRKHPRAWGHIRGASIVSSIVSEADLLGIKKLTLYAFSSENWSRPLPEIKTLFLLLKKFIKSEEERIIKNNILFRVMGNLSGIPEEIKKLIQELEYRTKNNTGLKLSFAFGYGSQQEILYSVNRFIESHPGQQMTIQDMAQNLYLPDLGDVDLMIRTGGDFRISNFLLWQLAYAELFFTETKWPDFTRLEFASIIESVKKRERRFGTIENLVKIDQVQNLAKTNKKMLTSLDVQYS